MNPKRYHRTQHAPEQSTLEYNVKPDPPSIQDRNQTQIPSNASNSYKGRQPANWRNSNPTQTSNSGSICRNRQSASRIQQETQSINTKSFPEEPRETMSWNRNATQHRDERSRQESRQPTNWRNRDLNHTSNADSGYTISAQQTSITQQQMQSVNPRRNQATTNQNYIGMQRSTADSGYAISAQQTSKTQSVNPRRSQATANQNYIGMQRSSANSGYAISAQQTSKMQSVNPRRSQATANQNYIGMQRSSANSGYAISAQQTSKMQSVNPRRSHATTNQNYIGMPRSSAEESNNWRPSTSRQPHHTNGSNARNSNEGRRVPANGYAMNNLDTKDHRRETTQPSVNARQQPANKRKKPSNHCHAPFCNKRDYDCEAEWAVSTVRPIDSTSRSEETVFVSISEAVVCFLQHSRSWLPHYHISEPYYSSPRQVGREMVRSSLPKEISSIENVFNFSVLSYNILSNKLLIDNGRLYFGYPEWLLDWEYRKKNLFKEIIHYNADVSITSTNLHFIPIKEPSMYNY